MKNLTQKEWIGIVVALGVLALFVTGFSQYLFPAPAADQAVQNADTSVTGAAMNGSATASATGTNGTATAAPVASANQLPTPKANQLLVHDLVVGTGTEAVAGDTVTVDYVGTLQNGTKFDSSVDRGTPFTFTLGAGQVIKGWDQGVVGMKIGGVRLLVIPPDLGYGASAVSTIPANSVLVFEIKLEGVK